MKNLFLSLVFLSLLGISGSSCSDDNVDLAATLTREYDADAQILAKFVDINKSAGEYYFNENKKTTPLSYISDKDLKELELVNPDNKVKFVKDLEYLNNELAIAAQREDVSQIVYNTYSETWIRNLKEDGFLSLEKSNKTGVMSRGHINSLSLWADKFVHRVTFTAGNQIYSKMQLYLFQYQRYFFEVSCDNSGVSHSPSWAGDAANAVIISGSGITEEFNYTWKINSSSTQIEWKFKGMMHSPYSDSNANVYIEFTD